MGSTNNIANTKRYYQWTSSVRSSNFYERCVEDDDVGETLVQETKQNRSIERRARRFWRRAKEITKRAAKRRALPSAALNQVAGARFLLHAPINQGTVLG